MKSVFLKLIPFFVIFLLTIGMPFSVNAILVGDIMWPWPDADGFLPMLVAFILAGCFHQWASQKAERKNAYFELIPLLVIVAVVFGMGIIIEWAFSPEDILKPWIYFADVVPWVMAVTLGYCLCRRLTKWNGFWRSVFIAVMGIWVGVPLDSVFHDVNDEIGARRMALAGSDDPYYLYSDESGMNENTGTQQLGHDTWEAFAYGLEESAFLFPIILGVAALVYYRAGIWKLFVRMIPVMAD
jgi:hypothetical protein